MECVVAFGHESSRGGYQREAFSGDYFVPGVAITLKFTQLSFLTNVCGPVCMLEVPETLWESTETKSVCFSIRVYQILDVQMRSGRNPKSIMMKTPEPKYRNIYHRLRAASKMDWEL